MLITAGADVAATSRVGRRAWAAPLFESTPFLVSPLFGSGNLATPLCMQPLQTATLPSRAYSLMILELTPTRLWFFP